MMALPAGLRGVRRGAERGECSQGRFGLDRQGSLTMCIGIGTGAHRPAAVPRATARGGGKLTMAFKGLHDGRHSGLRSPDLVEARE